MDWERGLARDRPHQIGRADAVHTADGDPPAHQVSPTAIACTRPRSVRSSRVVRRNPWISQRLTSESARESSCTTFAEPVASHSG